MRRPWSVPAALLKRWRDPITASIELHGTVSNAPPLPLQLGCYLTRVAKFLSRSLRRSSPGAARFSRARSG